MSAPVDDAVGAREVTVIAFLKRLWDRLINESWTA